MNSSPLQRPTTARSPSVLRRIAARRRSTSSAACRP
jgi:hypothetical protein